MSTISLRKAVDRLATEISPSLVSVSTARRRWIWSLLEFRLFGAAPPPACLGEKVNLARYMSTRAVYIPMYMSACWNGQDKDFISKRKRLDKDSEDVLCSHQGALALALQSS